MRNTTRSLVAVLLLALGASGLSAQSLIYGFTGGGPFDWCYGVSNPMQLDADGTPDFVLTCFGLATAISGQTGEILYEFSTAEFAVEARRIGDLNGDGLDEYILGQPYFIDLFGYAGAVTVHSGADGAVLFGEIGLDDQNFDGAGEMLGWDVDGCGDVDGDGVPDFIYSGVGDQGLFEPCAQTTDGGTVRVRSGADFTLIATHVGAPFCGGIGGSTIGVGDLDQDGFADYAYNAYGDNGGAGNYVSIRSGFDQSEIRRHLPAPGRDYLGMVAVLLGDVDGDGIDDYALGNPFSDGSALTAFDAYLEVFSGATGLLIHDLDYTSYGAGFADNFGWAASNVGDLNGDGLDDFALSILRDDVGGATDSGRVLVLSGADATVLKTLNGGFAGEVFGAALCGIGDANVDGETDLVVSSLNATTQLLEVGRVQLFSLEDLELRAAPHLVSVTSGGTIVFSLDAGAAEAGNTYFVIGSATGFAPGVATANGVYVPLVPDAYFQSTLDPNLNPIANWTGFLDVIGRAGASLTIPAGYFNAQVAGITIYHAFITYDFMAGDFSIASNQVATSFSL